MDNGQLLLAAPMAALVIEIGHYGIKEWLAVLGSLFGIGGSVFGVWRAWRYSKSQIAERLMDYLADEEAKVKEARDRIIRHLRHGDPLGNEIEHEFFSGMADALKETSQSDRKLGVLADTICRDIELGQKYLETTNLSLGTLHLARGALSKANSEPVAARAALEQALQCNSQDAEAERYLGELALASSDADTAEEHFSRAYALAPDDKLLEAETLEAMASHYQQQGQRKSELQALALCAPIFANVQDYGRAASLYARGGELANQLKHTKQGPELLTMAFENYKLVGDQGGMTEMRRRLEGVGADVSHLPSFEEARRRSVPWFWIRIAIEVSILGAAIYALAISR